MFLFAILSRKRILFIEMFNKMTCYCEYAFLTFIFICLAIDAMLIHKSLIRYRTIYSSDLISNNVKMI